MLRTVSLYGKRGIRPNRYRKRRGIPHMTLILGARCPDGVVMVGDRKVIMDNGGFRSINKIRQCEVEGLEWAIFGASGMGTLFEEFLESLPQKVSYHYNLVKYRNEMTKRRLVQEFGEPPQELRPLNWCITIRISGMTA